MPAKRRWPKGTWMKLHSTATLKALMAQKGFSYERLARYAGCSRGFISHLTNGRKPSCSVELAIKLSEALDVPVEVLFAASDSTDGRSFAKHKGAA